jgi:hypothetical protein
METFKVYRILPAHMSRRISKRVLDVLTWVAPVGAAAKPLFSSRYGWRMPYWLI